MVAMLCISAGGNGGGGAVGAVSTAGGGGGGASGKIAFVCVPINRLPETLFVDVSASPFIVIGPGALVQGNGVLYASGGAAGANGGAGTGGAGAPSVSVPLISDQPLAGMGVFNFIVNQAGIIGGAAIAGANLTLPTTGIIVTGGTGGGGLGATAVVGKDGGSFTVSGAFPPHSGGLGGSAATTPGGHGSNGFDNVIAGLRYSYGGTGGGSSHGSATGAGLFGGNGGAGGIGCGGGGGGGCLTGGVAGVGGRGGPGQIVIIAW